MQGILAHDFRKHTRLFFYKQPHFLVSTRFVFTLKQTMSKEQTFVIITWKKNFREPNGSTKTWIKVVGEKYTRARMSLTGLKLFLVKKCQ